MALTDLYTVVPGMQEEDDEAAGLPLSSRAPARSIKDSLSSFEDDLSLNRTPLGEDDSTKSSGEPPRAKGPVNDMDSIPSLRG